MHVACEIGNTNLSQGALSQVFDTLQDNLRDLYLPVER